MSATVIPFPARMRPHLAKAEQLRIEFQAMQGVFEAFPTPERARALRALRQQWLTVTLLAFGPLIPSRSGALTMMLFDHYLDEKCPDWRFQHDGAA